jgi:hypothetical protein
VQLSEQIERVEVLLDHRTYIAVFGTDTQGTRTLRNVLTTMNYGGRPGRRGVPRVTRAVRQGGATWNKVQAATALTAARSEKP